MITEAQRKRIIQIANTNLLVGLHHATVEQQAYVESTGMRGRMKLTYKRFQGAGDIFIKEWEKTPQMFEQSEMISDKIHDMLFNLREQFVKDYIKFIEDEA